MAEDSPRQCRPGAFALTADRLGAPGVPAALCTLRQGVEALSAGRTSLSRPRSAGHLAHGDSGEEGRRALPLQKPTGRADGLLGGRGRRKGSSELVDPRASRPAPSQGPATQGLALPQGPLAVPPTWTESYSYAGLG